MRLLAWLGGTGDECQGAAAPSRGEALYVGQQAGGGRRTCASCSFWRESERSCLLHDPVEVLADADTVCRRHLAGSPLAGNQDAGEREVTQLATLDPELNDFQQVKLGASCDQCSHYEARSPIDGVCHGLALEDGAPPVVAALGFCTRFELPEGD